MIRWQEIEYSLHAIILPSRDRVSLIIFSHSGPQALELDTLSYCSCVPNNLGLHLSRRQKKKVGVGFSSNFHSCNWRVGNLSLIHLVWLHNSHSVWCAQGSFFIFSYSFTHLVCKMSFYMYLYVLSYMSYQISACFKLK